MPGTALTAPEPIVVVGMPPLWGLPSPSPFCTKLETWLRMAGLPYTTDVVAGPIPSRTGKIPFLRRADGRLLPDSQLIITQLTAEHRVTLDDHLSSEQQVSAHLARRTLEEHLYYALAWERWVRPEAWPTLRDAYFAPAPGPLRPLIGGFVRRKVRGYLHGMGLGRLQPEEIVARAAEDLDALDALLGDREWVFGRPSSADALYYAFVAGILAFPVDGPIRELTRGHRRLVAHSTRVRARWWADAGPAPFLTGE